MKSTKDDALIVLKALKTESKPAMKKISSLEITTNEDFDVAASLMKTLKEKGKAAETREKGMTDPLKMVIDDIKSLFKPFRDSIKFLEIDTKNKMTEFIETQKAATKKLDEKFEDGKIKKVSTVVAKKAELEVKSSSAQIRKVWKATMVDGSKTPRKYLVPDEAAIKDALRAGKKVPGWKWEQVESIAI